MSAPKSSVDWDTRYKKGWAYGKEPSEFLARAAAQFLARKPDGRRLRCLCLFEGTGRNAVHLAAAHGHSCTCVDSSSVALAKAELLAAQTLLLPPPPTASSPLDEQYTDLAGNCLLIRTECADLATYCPSTAFLNAAFKGAERGKEGEQDDDDDNKEKIDKSREAYDVVVSIFGCGLSRAERKALHARCAAALKPGGIVIVECFHPQHFANTQENKESAQGCGMPSAAKIDRGGGGGIGGSDGCGDGDGSGGGETAAAAAKVDANVAGGGGGPGGDGEYKGGDGESSASGGGGGGAVPRSVRKGGGGPTSIEQYATPEELFEEFSSAPRLPAALTSVSPTTSRSLLLLAPSHFEVLLAQTVERPLREGKFHRIELAVLTHFVARKVAATAEQRIVGVANKCSTTTHQTTVDKLATPAMCLSAELPAAKHEKTLQTTPIQEGADVGSCFCNESQVPHNKSSFHASMDVVFNGQEVASLPSPSEVSAPPPLFALPLSSDARYASGFQHHSSRSEALMRQVAKEAAVAFKKAANSFTAQANAQKETAAGADAGADDVAAVYAAYGEKKETAMPQAIATCTKKDGKSAVVAGGGSEMSSRDPFLFCAQACVKIACLAASDTTSFLGSADAEVCGGLSVVETKVETDFKVGHEEKPNLGKIEETAKSGGKGGICRYCWIQPQKECICAAVVRSVQQLPAKYSDGTAATSTASTATDHGKEEEISQNVMTVPLQNVISDKGKSLHQPSLSTPNNSPKSQCGRQHLRVEFKVLCHPCEFLRSTSSAKIAANVLSMAQAPANHFPPLHFERSGHKQESNRAYDGEGNVNRDRGPSLTVDVGCELMVFGAEGEHHSDQKLSALVQNEQDRESQGPSTLSTGRMCGNGNASSDSSDSSDSSSSSSSSRGPGGYNEMEKAKNSVVILYPGTWDESLTVAAAIREVVAPCSSSTSEDVTTRVCLNEKGKPRDEASANVDDHDGPCVLTVLVPDGSWECTKALVKELKLWAADGSGSPPLRCVRLADDAVASHHSPLIEALKAGQGLGRLTTLEAMALFLGEAADSLSPSEGKDGDNGGEDGTTAADDDDDDDDKVLGNSKPLPHMIESSESRSTADGGGCDDDTASLHLRSLADRLLAGLTPLVEHVKKTKHGSSDSSSRLFLSPNVLSSSKRARPAGTSMPTIPRSVLQAWTSAFKSVITEATAAPVLSPPPLVSTAAPLFFPLGLRHCCVCGETLATPHRMAQHVQGKQHCENVARRHLLSEYWSSGAAVKTKSGAAVYCKSTAVVVSGDGGSGGGDGGKGSNPPRFHKQHMFPSPNSSTAAEAFQAHSTQPLFCESNPEPPDVALVILLDALAKAKLSVEV